LCAPLSPSPLSFFANHLIAQGLILIELFEIPARQYPGDQEQTEENHAQRVRNAVQGAAAEWSVADCPEQNCQQEKDFGYQPHSLPCDLLSRSQAPRSPGGAALPPLSPVLLTLAHLPRVLFRFIPSGTDRLRSNFIVSLELI
jgi:hypothetical protein